jgi:peptidoglycan/LPS O-acetylase OafA/YrhL
MNRQFPALRGVAILIVVLYHSIEWATLGPQGLGYAPARGWQRYVLSALLELGVFAVPTFLFISGSFAAYAARGTPPTISWKTLRAGLARIVWPYLIWSILYYVTIYVRREETYSFTGYLKNLVVGYPYHFVPLLLLFYILSPIMVRLAQRLAGLLVVVIAAYQIVLINVQFPSMFGFLSATWMQRLVPPVVGHTFAEWGIYFPLGLVYGLKMKALLPWLRKLKWVSLVGNCAFFILALLHATSILECPLAGYLSSLTSMCLLPVIKRNSIPVVHRLEEVGKKSYGLYLMHLIVLSFGFLAVQLLAPWLLSYPILVAPILFALGVVIPVAVMNGAMRLMSRAPYRRVFG